MTYETELLAAIGDAGDPWDIRVSTRRFFHYDFDGSPVYLWDGEGPAYTSTGQKWLGTWADGVNFHQAPAVRDNRDGSSPRYTFGLPYLDQDRYEAIKADQTLALGRDLTVYHGIFLEGEGLRPATPLKFAYRLTMQGVEASENWLGEPGRGIRFYGMTVICRSDNVGRSRAPRGTYTDTSQRDRARVLGEASDSGCSFVAGNANRTYRQGG